MEELGCHEYYEEGFGWKKYVSNTQAEEVNNSLFIFLEKNLVFLAVSFLFTACLCSSPASAAELLKKRPSVVETVTNASEVYLRVPAVLTSVKNLGKRHRLGTFGESFYGSLLIHVFEAESAVRDKNVLRYFETLNFDLKTAKFQNSTINSYSQMRGGSLPSLSVVQNSFKVLKYYLSRNPEKANSNKENFDFSRFTPESERERLKRGKFYSVSLVEMLPIGVIVCFLLFKKDKLQKILTRCFEKVGLLEKETASEKRLLRVKQFLVDNRYSFALLLVCLVLLIFVLKNKSLFKFNPITLAFEFIGNIFGEYSRLVSMTIGLSNTRMDEALNRLNRLAESDHLLVQQLQHEKVSLVRKLAIEEQVRHSLDLDILQCGQNNLDAQKLIGNLEFKVKHQKELLENYDFVSSRQQSSPKQGFLGNFVNRLKGNDQEKDDSNMKYLDMKYLDMNHN